MTALNAPPRPGEQTTLAAPAATRFRRPGWRDPRLLVGMLLVCGSVVVGAQVLSSRDDVAHVWAVQGAVAQGERIGSDDLRPVGVRFADESDAEAYVSAESPVADGTVVTRDLAPGELVPASALGEDGEALLELPLTVPGGGVPMGLAPGDRVDVWVVPMARTATRAPRGDEVLSQVPVLRVGGRGMGGPDATRQVVVGVDDGARLDGVVGQLADSHVVLVRRP